MPNTKPSQLSSAYATLSTWGLSNCKQQKLNAAVQLTSIAVQEYLGNSNVAAAIGEFVKLRKKLENEL